jgi:hypothetical protein
MNYPDRNDEGSRMARKAAGGLLRELARLSDSSTDPAVRETCRHGLEGGLLHLKQTLADPKLPAWLREELEAAQSDFRHS